MYDLLWQMLAAIFGNVAGSLKITSKTKYFISILAGGGFFITYSIFFLFDSRVEDKKRAALIAAEVSGYLIVCLFILFLAIEYVHKYQLNKQKKTDRDK